MSSNKKAEIAYSIVHTIVSDYINKSIDTESAIKKIATHFVKELNSKGYFDKILNIEGNIDRFRFDKHLMYITNEDNSQVD